MAIPAIADLVLFTQLGDFVSLQKHISEITSSGTDINTILDESQCSLLHWAAINNRLKISLYLLSLNANINASGGTLMETPLHWAIRNDKSTFLVHLLICKGSNINQKNIYGHSALQVAVRSGNIHNCFLL